MGLMTGTVMRLGEAQQIAANRLPDIEEAIGIPAAHWGGRCHEISLQILRTGMFGAGRVARGTAEHVPGQHSWIILGHDCFSEKAIIVDPTWWFYRGDERPAIWVGYNNRRSHYPHGGTSIWSYGRPQEPTGPVIELAGYDELSYEAKRFLRLLGQLDWRGWAQLSGGPLLGWPAGEIIAAIYRTPSIMAAPPIDAVGMTTDLNPRNLYW